MNYTRTKKSRTKSEGICPAGFIKRNPYNKTLKTGKRVHVFGKCIIDRGLPGKGTRKGSIGTLRKGELTKYGYKNVINLLPIQRMSALKKAIKEFGSLGVWRKLNAVAVLTKYTSPKISKIFKNDMAWIRSEFGIKAF
jgi:hypothetical protein